MRRQDLSISLVVMLVAACTAAGRGGEGSERAESRVCKNKVKVGFARTKYERRAGGSEGGREGGRGRGTGRACKHHEEGEGCAWFQAR